jgi:hypothetical protein
VLRILAKNDNGLSEESAFIKEIERFGGWQESEENLPMFWWLKS